MAHPHAPPLVTPSADARERQRLVERFRDAIGKARAAVTTKFGLTGVRIPLPLHGGENETELRQRLKDAGARASEDLEHVIAVATAEAMASKDGEGIRWLGWNLGRSRSWDRALATSPELAAGSGKAKSVFDAVDAAVERLEREHGGKP